MNLKIGPIIYKVIKTKKPIFEGKKVIGKIDYFEQTIEILQELEVDYAWVNLWHECLHGILHTAGYEDHDEQLISVLAHGICQVLRDNVCTHRPEGEK